MSSRPAFLPPSSPVPFFSLSPPGRCGRVITKGHRQHLNKCQGREEAEPIVLTEEEARVQVRAVCVCSHLCGRRWLLGLYRRVLLQGF